MAPLQTGPSGRNNDNFTTIVPSDVLRPQRRCFLKSVTAAAISSLVGASIAGCQPKSNSGIRKPDLVWAKRGLSEGRLSKPRAMTIDARDNIYIVDMTGRIQVFDRDGNYLRGWRTPAIASGRPTGLGIGNDGSLLVADTHYFRVLFYTPDGELQDDRTIGGTFGDEPSQFHFVTDVVQNSKGHVLAGQYGQLDQIQEFDEQGKFVRRWGHQGSDIDGFARPQGLLLENDNRLWIADACNHRILVFDTSGPEVHLEQCISGPGKLPGQLHYPYGIAFDTDGTFLVAEYGNHRVQRFSRSGESLEIWGGPGSDPGQFSSPWALALDSHRSIHVLDTLNHRVQRFDQT